MVEPKNKKKAMGEYVQFALLLLGLVCMGAGTGFERSLLPRMAVDVFHCASASTRLNFVATFGGFKALANVISGPLADRYGRRPTLALGFLVGLPVMPYVIVARTWTGITVMNVAFGLSQGLLGSSLFFLLIDVMGPKNRGVAVGLGECVIFVTTALVNVWAGHLATEYGYRPVPFYYATGFCVLGLLSTIPLRDTLDKVRDEQQSEREGRWDANGVGGGSSDDDDDDEEDLDDDDLSDEADFLEYGIRPDDGCAVGVGILKHPSWTPDTVSIRTEDEATTTTTIANERTPLVPTLHPASEADSAAKGLPSMKRVWSGDFEDFESDLERMLRTVKGAPSGATAGPLGEESTTTMPFGESLPGQGSPKERKGGPPPRRASRLGLRRDASGGSSSFGGGSVAKGHRRRRRLSSGSAASAGSGGSGGSVRLISETQWTRYMSAEPPSAAAAREKKATGGRAKREEDGAGAPAALHAAEPEPGGSMEPDSPRVVMKRLLTNANYVSLCLAGMASNFKDGFAWGTFPVFFSNVHHLSDSRTDLLIALYPLCWGLAQAFTGAASDQFGRQLFLTSGMASCTVAMLLFALPEVIWGDKYEYLGMVDAAGFVWIVADILLGLGTALVYPALQAGAADEVEPINRGLGLGFYRFARDCGYVVGALACGRLTDSIGYQATLLAVAGVMAGGTFLMGWVYTPRKGRTVLIGGGRRVVIKTREEEVITGLGKRTMSAGFAD